MDKQEVLNLCITMLCVTERETTSFTDGGTRSFLLDKSSLLLLVYSYLQQLSLFSLTTLL